MSSSQRPSENSVLFSLRELRRIEDDRVKKEQDAARAKSEADRQSREDAERRAREAEDQRIREEQDRVRMAREADEQRQRDDHMRLQEAERRARVEGEMRINEERMRLEIQHRKKHSPVKAVLTVAGVLVLIGGGIGYKMYSDHQQDLAVARADKERVEAEARKARAELEKALENLKKETDARLASIKDENQRAIVRAEYEARKAALEGHSTPKVHKQVVEEPKATTVPTMQKRKISDNPLDGLDLDEPSSSKKKK